MTLCRLSKLKEREWIELPYGNGLGELKIVAPVCLICGFEAFQRDIKLLCTLQAVMRRIPITKLDKRRCLRTPLKDILGFEEINNFSGIFNLLLLIRDLLSRSINSCLLCYHLRIDIGQFKASIVGHLYAFLVLTNIRSFA